jgi:hypothetical protein
MKTTRNTPGNCSGHFLRTAHENCAAGHRYSTGGRRDSSPLPCGERVRVRGAREPKRGATANVGAVRPVPQRGIAVTSTVIVTPGSVRAGSEIPVVAGPGSVKHAERIRRLAFRSSAVPPVL